MRTCITSIHFANLPPDRYTAVYRSDGSKREYHYPVFNKWGTPYQPKWHTRLEYAYKRSIKNE